MGNTKTYEEHRAGKVHKGNCKEVRDVENGESAMLHRPTQESGKRKHP